MPPSLHGSRITGVHERPQSQPPPQPAQAAPPHDAIEDIHPIELEYTATLLELGALSLRRSGERARDSQAHDRAPHLYRRALQLARERGPYASVASIEGALEALRIVHSDAEQLVRSVDRARELLASMRPGAGDPDPSR